MLLLYPHFLLQSVDILLPVQSEFNGPALCWEPGRRRGGAPQGSLPWGLSSWSRTRPAAQQSHLRSSETPGPLRWVGAASRVSEIGLTGEPARENRFIKRPGEERGHAGKECQSESVTRGGGDNALP